MQWFVFSNRREFGPLTSQQLKQLAIDGKLHPSTQVRRDQDDRWYDASHVKGLFNFADNSSSMPTSQAEFASPPSSKTPLSTELAPFKTSEGASPDVRAEKVGFFNFRPSTPGEAKYMARKGAIYLWVVSGIQGLVAVIGLSTSAGRDTTKVDRASIEDYGMSFVGILIALLAFAICQSVLAYYLYTIQSRIAAILVLLLAALNVLSLFASEGTSRGGMTIPVAWICAWAGIGALRYHQMMPTRALSN
ncbi:MAG: DUF4339 domain-containing protein [Pirellulales bacterium]